MIWPKWNTLQHPCVLSILATLYSDYMLTSGIEKLFCSATSFTFISQVLSVPLLLTHTIWFHIVVTRIIIYNISYTLICRVIMSYLVVKATNIYNFSS